MVRHLFLFLGAKIGTFSEVYKGKITQYKKKLLSKRDV